MKRDRGAIGVREGNFLVGYLFAPIGSKSDEVGPTPRFRQEPPPS